MIFNYIGIAICGVRMAESLLVGCNFVSGICKLKSVKKVKNLKRPKNLKHGKKKPRPCARVLCLFSALDVCWYEERLASFHNQIRHAGEFESGDTKWFLICEGINGSCSHIWSKAKLLNFAKSIAKWMTLRKDLRYPGGGKCWSDLPLLFKLQTARVMWSVDS